MKKAIAILFLCLTLSAGTFAFPSAYYPGNQYGHGAYFYGGPWGERMVYGGSGYFPNMYGYPPYGYRAYGHMYTTWDMRYGRAW